VLAGWAAAALLAAGPALAPARCLNRIPVRVRRSAAGRAGQRSGRRPACAVSAGPRSFWATSCRRRTGSHSRRANVEQPPARNGPHEANQNRYNTRSGMHLRVRRQGLEPRTRGLRVRCSGIGSVLSLAASTGLRAATPVSVSADVGQCRAVPGQTSKHRANTMSSRGCGLRRRRWRVPPISGRSGW
jgi:hypothetical protein